MGMPISSYTILNSLRNDNTDSYGRNVAQKALEPFNLFVFIIHDPHLHLDLAEYLQDSFDNLDFVTGNKLLFFSLVDPPFSWSHHASNRPYYQTLNSYSRRSNSNSFESEYLPYETRELLNPSNSIFSNDQSTTAVALARSLGIPAEDLPCIVIIPSFDSNEILWFKTCSDHLDEQLTRLGYIAARSGKTKDLIIKKIREEKLDLCYGRGEVELDMNLATVISDVLSFIIASQSSNDYWIDKQSFNQAKKVISELYQSLTRLKNNHINSAEEIENLCTKIVAFLSNFNTTEESRLHQVSTVLPIDKTFLEYESYQILKTACRVSSLLTLQDERIELLLNPEEKMDFTPGVICLAKVFEREINLSIVHWIRSYLGVDLPLYYNRYQPHKNAKFRPSFKNSRDIDFNNRDHKHKWLPPGMGQSEIACRELVQFQTPKGWDKESLEVLLSRWKVIRERRNDAAHSSLVGSNHLNAVNKSLIDLSRSNAFEKLYQMKLEYRGT